MNEYVLYLQGREITYKEILDIQLLVKKHKFHPVQKLADWVDKSKIPWENYVEVAEEDLKELFIENREHFDIRILSQLDFLVDYFEQHPEDIDYNLLSSNEGAEKLLSANLVAVNWDRLSHNVGCKNLLIKYPEKLVFKRVVNIAWAVPELMNYFEKNIDSIGENHLHLHAEFLPLLKKYPEKIVWDKLVTTSDPKLISLFEIHIDSITEIVNWEYFSRYCTVTSILERYRGRLNLPALNRNVHAVEMLKKYPELIIWEELSGNEAAFDMVYEQLPGIFYPDSIICCNTKDPRLSEVILTYFSDEDILRNIDGIYFLPWEIGNPIFEKRPEFICRTTFAVYNKFWYKRVAMKNIEKLDFVFEYGTPGMAELLRKYPEKIGNKITFFSKNPTEFDLLKEYIKEHRTKEDVAELVSLDSQLPELFDLIEENIDDLIDYGPFYSDCPAGYLYEKYKHLLDPDNIHLISRNRHAIPFLQANPELIEYDSLIHNRGIYELRVPETEAKYRNIIREIVPKLIELIKI